MSIKVYVCSSVGAVNNGRVLECLVRLELEEGSTYHCPTCASLLVEETDDMTPTERQVKRWDDETKKLAAKTSTQADWQRWQ